jgi:hypothetical protein
MKAIYRSPVKSKIQTYIMFSSPVDYQKPNPRRVPSRFLRYLNTGILAFGIAIAIALLVTTRGKESEANQAPSGNATESGVIADNCQDNSHSVRGEVVQKKLPLPEARRFIGRVISAFNDPFLIEYANQQGTDIPNSATLLNNSGQSPVPSRSPSSQSRRSSSSY